MPGSALADALGLLVAGGTVAAVFVWLDPELRSTRALNREVRARRRHAAAMNALARLGQEARHG